MFEHSFYFAEKRKTYAEIIDFIRNTNKPFKYTYGYKYRHPTTYLVPISREKAIEIVGSETLLDVEEKDDYIDLNAYSSNDMW